MNEPEDIVRDSAAQQGWDMRPYETALKIKQAIEPLTDRGTSIDSGTGLGEDENIVADLHPTIDGVEYHVTVKLSGRQRRLEAQ